MTVRDRVDPESRIPLEGLLSVMPGGFNSIPDIVQRRAVLSQMLSATPVPPNPNIEISNHVAKGPAGDIAVRVYTPKECWRKCSRAGVHPWRRHDHGWA